MNRALIFFVALSLSGCGSSPTGPVPQGNWGGQHIGLIVTDTGATINYDCAHGTIDQALVAADGIFTAIGTHYQEHGGPIRDGEPVDKHPARYDGRTDGKTMTLDVTLTDSDQKLGTFKLERGASPNVFKCL
ncbi:MAG: hypothetical protein ABR582_07110 [Gemmatimonadaceae bacterium]